MADSPPNLAVRVLSSLALCAILFKPGIGVAGGFETHCLPTPTASPPERRLVATPKDLARILSGARPGDTILLQGGTYGPVRLSGANSGFISLEGAPGHTAVISSLLITGSRWAVRNVTLDAHSSDDGRLPAPPADRWQFHDWIVKIRGGDNIIFADNRITSLQGVFPWRSEAVGVDDATPLWSGILVQNASCVSVIDNDIRNVFNGIAVEGDQQGLNGLYYLIRKNLIRDFAGDAIDHSVSHAEITQNIISANHNICESRCIHSDGIQGWNYHNQPGLVNIDIDISRNQILQSPGTDPVSSGDALQGITIFDGSWKDIRITNNVIVTVAWHGITINGADGLVIENNTVLGSTTRQTWISAGGSTHEGGVSDHVIVRNNLASAYAIPKAFAAHVQFDHNLKVADPRSVFKAFDPSANRYDLHLRNGSAAIGAGATEGAPPLDFDGAPRTGRIDLGAYQLRR